MLRELALWITTPCPLPAARRLGYLQESIAIDARHRRCRAAWAPHLAQTQAAIRTAITRCTQKRTALILGSGSLLDVPIDALSESFAEVILADIIHPYRARRMARKYSNIALQFIDISGIDAHNLPTTSQSPLPTPQMNFGQGQQDIDLVISANLLSQLPLIPERLLRQKGWDEKAIHHFCRQLISAHLDYLRGFEQAERCLITDTETLIYDREKLRVRDDRLYGVSLPTAERCWRWHIAPKGEIDARDHYRDVVAVMEL